MKADFHNSPAQNSPAHNNPVENSPAQNSPAQNSPAQNSPGFNLNLAFRLANMKVTTLLWILSATSYLNIFGLCEGSSSTTPPVHEEEALQKRYLLCLRFHSKDFID